MIYVSSPYSSPDPKTQERNFKDATSFCAFGIQNGFTLISPIVYGHPIIQENPMPSDWEFWNNFCLDVLKKCEKMVILCLEGWEKSAGVAGEIKYCQENVPTRAPDCHHRRS